MPKAKIKYSEYTETDEYKLWRRLKELCDILNLNGVKYIGMKDCGGVYWEPLLEAILKLGVILKIVPKNIKEIKMDMMRPLLFLEANSDGKVIFDEEEIEVDKGAIGAATSIKFSFQKVLDCIQKVDELSDENLVKEIKDFKDNLKLYFKYFSAYLKEGFRKLHETVKSVLLPLRLVRKSGYRLLSLEKLEENNVDLTIFKDKKTFNQLVKDVTEYFKNEEFIFQKEMNENEFNKFLDKEISNNYYEYLFTDKIRNEDNKNKLENPFESVANRENKRKINKRRIVQNIKSNEENEEEQKKKLYEKLININIDNIELEAPNSFIKELFQKDFEYGITQMILHLHKKWNTQFIRTFDAHKIFVNIKYIPHNKNESPHSYYYLSKIKDEIYKLKIKCYEMKLNGLSRVLIPIRKNTEFCQIIKNIYLYQLIIEDTMGDILKLQQYNFIYTLIFQIYHSNLNEVLLNSNKHRHFIERNIPQYIFFKFLCKACDSYYNMKIAANKQKREFKEENYFQLNNLFSNDNSIYEYELLSEDTKFKSKIDPLIKAKIDNRTILENEVKKYGWFFLCKNFIDPNDTAKVKELIYKLNEININVRDEMASLLLMNNIEEINQIEKGKENITMAPETFDIESFIDKMNNKKKNPRINKRNTYTTKHEVKQKTKRENKNNKNQSPNKNSNIITNIEALQPPNVWNFPIQKIKDYNKKVLEESDHNNDNNNDNNNNPNAPKYIFTLKNPTNCYNDGRIQNFFKDFQSIFYKSMIYCKDNQDEKMFFILDKLFTILNINFSGFKRFKISFEIFDETEARLQLEEAKKLEEKKRRFGQQNNK